MPRIVLTARDKYIICQSMKKQGRYCELARRLNKKAGAIRKFWLKYVENQKKNVNENEQYEFDYIVKHVFKKYKGKCIRKHPKFEIKWKNHTETELIKLNQFTSKNDVIEYLLDTIYALEHPPMTP